MSTSAVKQSLAVYAHAIDAVGLAKRAALQTARSCSGIAEATFPASRPGPWTFVDAGLDSAESYVIAQQSFVRSVLDATAAALGVSVTTDASPVARRPDVETVVEPAAPASPPRTPKPPANVEIAAASTAEKPKPPANAARAAAPTPKTPKLSATTDRTEPKTPKAGGGTKGA